MFESSSRIISPSLSPNTESDDVWESLKMIVTPWKWRNGASIEKVEQWFRQKFNTPYVTSFNSGRSALLAILKAFNIGLQDEVLVQAFTCVAVPNSILWVGAKPIYVDIDEAFNIDPKDVERKLSSRTKAIIVQHTFGIPSRLGDIQKLAKQFKLILIEDCAHSLGASYKNGKIGTFGDAAFFSFGRDKVISSVFGGIAIINQKFNTQGAAIRKFQQSLKEPTYFWIFQQLLHPIAFSFILPSYNIIIGKILLFLMQFLHLLSFPIYPEEKQGQRPKIFPSKYPNALALLTLHQLRKLEVYNTTRRDVATYYSQHLSIPVVLTNLQIHSGAVYLRYPILVLDPLSMQQRVKRKGILLGNWYHNVIDPKAIDLDKIGYTRGSCPKAEYAASHILNLPTRITLAQAKRVVDALHEYKNK